MNNNLRQELRVLDDVYGPWDAEKEAMYTQHQEAEVEIYRDEKTILEIYQSLAEKMELTVGEYQDAMLLLEQEHKARKDLNHRIFMWNQRWPR